MIGTIRRRRRYIDYTAIVCIAVLQLTSCSFLPRTPTIVDILPRETDVPGWNIAQQYRTSSLKKIRELNSLCAEYDPVELIAAEYGRISDETKTISLEIIRFRSALDSFGMYSRDRGLDGAVSAEGDKDCASDGNVFSRHGKYYVRIRGENLDAQESEAIEQFRSVVKQNLKGKGGDESLPDSLFIFSQDRSTGNIVYYKKGMGLVPGLKNVSVMRRALGGKKTDVLYAKMTSVLDAEQQFNAILKTGGNAFILSKIGSLETAIRIISDTEYLFVSHYKQWIFGVRNADTMNEGNRIILYLFGEIKARIEKKDIKADGL
jgi:hypothetical protein